MELTKKTQNATIDFEPVKITDKIEASVSKTISEGRTRITIKFIKDGESVGSSSYDEKGDFIMTSIKPKSSVTTAEIVSIYKAIPEIFTEVLNG